jgi:Protein of unknown function (DUF3300)
VLHQNTGVLLMAAVISLAFVIDFWPVPQRRRVCGAILRIVSPIAFAAVARNCLAVLTGRNRLTKDEGKVTRKGRGTMQVKILQARPAFEAVRSGVALLCALLLLSGDLTVYAQSPPQQDASQEQPAPVIPNDQLDSLVAPIALYPDPMLAQVLAASTYPLEIIQLQQWLAQHKDLKDKALVEAVGKEDWDASVQAMAPLPDVVKQLAENIKWTTDLGNAFLAQQNDVMEAVQRMRMKAKGAGNLKSTEQQKVETKTVENKTVVVIEQAQPEVIYVPSYNPTVVYGAPAYPYPPIVYPPPPSTGAVVAGMAISFGVGMAMGAAWHGGWGYNCGWGGGGHNDITINNNNSFVNNSNRTNVNRPSQRPAGGGNNWQHNPQHRGGAPYSNRATANQYGGSARGDSRATRQANARQNQGQMGGRQQAGTMDRGGGGRQQAGSMDRGGSNRQQPSAANRGGGGADRVGNRSVPSGGSSRGGGAFGGGSGGNTKSAARASSSRGASSMGSRSAGSRGGSRRR